MAGTCRNCVSILLLAGLLLGSTVPPAGAVDQQPREAIAAGASPNPDSNTRARLNHEPELVQTLSFERLPNHPGEIRVEVRHTVPATVERLRVNLSTPAAYEQRRLSNLTVRHGERVGPRTYEFEGKDLETATLSFRFSVNQTAQVPDASSAASAGFEYVDTAAWAFFNTARVSDAMYTRWWYDGQAPTFRQRFVVADNQSGAVGHESYGFLGAYDATTIETNTGSARLVVPRAVGNSTRATATEEALFASAKELHIAPGGTTSTLIMTPRLVRNGGAAYDRVFWFSVKSEPRDAGSTVTHEYVHTRQQFTTDKHMDWIYEGSAEFYDDTVPLRQGWSTYRTTRTALRDSEYVRANLTRPSQWDAAYVDYEAGEHAVALLHARIHTETNGEESFQDVLYWMNRHEGPVGVSEFKAIVERVVGHSLDAYIDRVLTNRTGMRVPDNPYLYAGSSVRDHDDDGLDNEAERSHGGHPFIADTDSDGLADGKEVALGTALTDRDTDGDGVTDGDEVAGDGNGDPLATPTPTPGTTPTPSPEPTPTEGAPDTDQAGTTEPTTAGGSGPGFTLLGGVCALVAAVVSAVATTGTPPCLASYVPLSRSFRTIVDQWPW